MTVGLPGIHSVFERQAKMRFDFLIEFPLAPPAIPRPVHSLYPSLGAGPTMAVIAFIICHQRCCSLISCFLPAGVRR
jgi:hypothetical protein